MSSLKRKQCGIISFPTGVISITDPGYDDDCWGRKDGVKIKPGEYHCSIYTQNNGKTVHIIQIRKKNAISVPQDNADWNQIGIIGVDAGLAGFFENKPNYDDAEWEKVCNQFLNNGTNCWKAEKTNSFLKCNCFFSSSGIGDGMYPVYGIKDKHNPDVYVCLEIRF